MSNTSLSVEEFLAQARDVLQATETDLETLAQVASSKSEQFVVEKDNGRDADPDLAPWFQQLNRQFASLAAHTKVILDYLQSDVDAIPADDQYWPRMRILQSQEEERMQLARTLEDSVGQLLANTVFELASYQQLLGKTHAAPADDGPLISGLEALQSELEEGLSDFRYFITELDPTTVLSNFGLGEGVRRYLEQYAAKTGLHTQLQINTNLGRLPTIVEIAIFRVVQEALNNVHQHANATRVDVTVGEKDSRLQFSVIDNGDGFESKKAGLSRKNLGLARMIDYAELLNGELRVLSEPKFGTQVILSIPHPTL